MLEYEWGNLVADPEAADPEAAVVAGHHGREFDGYGHYYGDGNSGNSLAGSFSLHHQFMAPPQIHELNLVNCVFDQRAYGGASYGYPPPPSQQQLPSSLLSLEPASMQISGSGGFLMVPKIEDGSRAVERHFGGGGSRIGLNLGGRTYFSSSEDDFVNRLYRRSKPAMEAGSVNAPRCQAEGCAADLTHAKHYHRRHKVCEFHSKVSTVVAAGLTQRFCQQCSRFHLLSEFDNGKRSCRKRLADHNRRRRKPQQSVNENQKSQLGITRNSSSDNLASSPPDSGVHSSSSVTVAISPPRMSLDCFPPRHYGAAQPAGASSSSSMFFSSG